ncbi:MAG TPA: sulfite exporter TauE/SafE family protein [Chryseosolibacter sp.]
MNIIILLIIGLVAGILGGLLGIGGAVIILPALVFALGYSQLQAQGTTLLMLVMPVGLLAAWQYYKDGHADVKAAIILAVTFFIGSYIGARLAIHIPAELLKKAFAVMLIVIALKMFFDTSH